MVETVAAAVYTFIVWKQRFWSVGWRIHYTLVTLIAVTVVWWYMNWNIIG